MLAVGIAGVVAGILSAPHCALMCGPLAAYSARATGRGSLHYQIGRALSYGVAGAIAGSLGQPVIRILWGSDFAVALSYALAMLMAIAAYRAWPKSPVQKTAGANKSAGGSDLLQITRAKDREATTKNVSRLLRVLRRASRRPMLLGAFSVLIPCAALWGGLVIAASSGSPHGGAFAMLAFALTSGSGLLASGFLAKALRQRPSHQRVLAVVFALGAVALVARPISMHLRGPSETAANSPPGALCPLHNGREQ